MTQTLAEALTLLRSNPAVALRSPDAAVVTHASLPLFICPSDDMFEPIIDIPSKSSTRIICQMAAANYVANAGTIRPTPMERHCSSTCRR